MKTLMTFLMSAVVVAAQVNIPDGTKLRVRLDQTISLRALPSKAKLSSFR